MNGNTVKITKELGLCSSCGICKGVCPKSCIEYTKTDGMYYPAIDHSKCIGCGICFDVCSSMSHSYKYADPIKATKGDSLFAVNAFSKNNDLRHVSASGGCVSTLVSKLIEQGLYDVATTVDTYDYKEQIKSTIINIDNISEDYSKTSYPKSRYLPVSHEDAVRFVLSNRDKKLIFIGTSCAIRGFHRVIDKFKLNRDNYLLIGLFCDKIFNYNIYDYYRTFADGKELTSLHFKNKDSGGWPGNMKLMFSDLSHKFVDSSERQKMKELFMPERCLYCIDKLNVEADISIGDNYTGHFSSSKGSNSVIIRTKRGLQAWACVTDDISSEDIDIDIIADEAQGIKARLNNAYYARFKERFVKAEYGRLSLNGNLDLRDSVSNYYGAYRRCMSKIAVGKDYDIKPNKLYTYLNNQKKQSTLSKITELYKRVYYKVLRMTYFKVLFK